MDNRNDMFSSEEDEEENGMHHYHNHNNKDGTSTTITTLSSNNNSNSEDCSKSSSSSSSSDCEYEDDDDDDDDDILILNDDEDDSDAGLDEQIDYLHQKQQLLQRASHQLAAETMYEASNARIDSSVRTNAITDNDNEASPNNKDAATIWKIAKDYLELHHCSSDDEEATSLLLAVGNTEKTSKKDNNTNGPTTKKSNQCQPPLFPPPSTTTGCQPVSGSSRKRRLAQIDTSNVQHVVVVNIQQQQQQQQQRNAAAVNEKRDMEKDWWSRGQHSLTNNSATPYTSRHLYSISKTITPLTATATTTTTSADSSSSWVAHALISSLAASASPLPSVSSSSFTTTANTTDWRIVTDVQTRASGILVPFGSCDDKKGGSLDAAPPSQNNTQKSSSRTSPTTTTTTLQQAIGLSNHARLVSQSTPPFAIVYANRAFLLLAGLESSASLIGAPMELVLRRHPTAMSPVSSSLSPSAIFTTNDNNNNNSRKKNKTDAPSDGMEQALLDEQKRIERRDALLLLSGTILVSLPTPNKSCAFRLVPVLDRSKYNSSSINDTFIDQNLKSSSSSSLSSSYMSHIMVEVTDTMATTTSTTGQTHNDVFPVPTGDSIAYPILDYYNNNNSASSTFPASFPWKPVENGEMAPGSSRSNIIPAARDDRLSLSSMAFEDLCGSSTIG